MRIHAGNISLFSANQSNDVRSFLEVPVHHSMTERPRPSRARVLIVDEDTIMANSLAMILETRGYSVRAVYSAEQALELANEYRPTVLVADITIPGLNVVDLALNFRRAHRDCKLLLISDKALTMGLTGDSHCRGSMYTLLPKPLQPGKLIQFLD